MEHGTSNRGLGPATLEVVETKHLRRAEVAGHAPGEGAADSSPPRVKPGGFRDPLIGKLLNDRYRIVRRIGKGGMGVVYLAEHELIGRKVAIKTLQASVFASDELVERFKREALAAAAIGNEHVVDVLDMGQLEDGSHYLVLEYLDGVELAAAIGSEGCLSIGRAVRIAMQLCDALAAVHAAGIVHRDLKPENVLLIDRSGRPDFVKVLDFGVCKFREGRASRLTETGAALGTPQFMAPEQVEGRSDVDARADLYAVGGILFHALTGADPFEAPSLPRLFMRICEEPPPHLGTLRPDVPEALAAIVSRALAKRPEERWQSSVELKAALAPFQDLDPAPVELPNAVEPSAPPRQPLEPPPVHVTEQPLLVPGRRRWPLRAVLVASALLAAAAVWQLASSDQLHRAERASPRAPAGMQPNARAEPAARTAAEASRQNIEAQPPDITSVAPAPRVAPPGPARVDSNRRPAFARKPDRAAPPAAEPDAPPAAATAVEGTVPSVEAPQPSQPSPRPSTAVAEPWPTPRELKHVF